MHWSVIKLSSGLKMRGTKMLDVGRQASGTLTMHTFDFDSFFAFRK